jgi:Ubiquitin family
MFGSRELSKPTSSLPHTNTGLRMRLTVRALVGGSMPLDPEPGDTTQRLYEMVAEAFHVSVEEVALVFAGRLIARSESRTLHECGLTRECCVHFIPRASLDEKTYYTVRVT